MATNRKSLAPALMFFTCVIFNIISMIISSSRFGYFHYNFMNIIVSIILPLALGAICFINSRSKALPPLYLVYALSRLFLDGFNVIGRNNGVIYSVSREVAGGAIAAPSESLSAVNITAIFVAVIYLLLFALTFLSRSFRTSNAGLICKLLLLLLAVVVVVMTIIRIRFLFRPYFNPAYLNNCIISINAVYLLLKN